ncbi:MAG: permease prefix domain 1-containing protein [Defluviitaleaceae bacterium]|nr:permease prefix domain 1-containing protein [Defluviitaleaceae bacterium]
METIKTYLDNIFTAFPKNERTESLKRDILAGLEEKYNDLLREGKSEHEAVGSVIANFGSIDEIVAELGIEPIKDDREDVIDVSSEDAFEYLSKTKKNGIKIGLGVWLILTGVAGLILISGSGIEAADAAGISVLFTAIAIAVGLFIFSGLGMSKYEEYEEYDIRLDAKTKEEIEQQAAGFLPRFAIQIIIGVALILFAVLGVAFASDLPTFSFIGINDLATFDAIELFSVALLLFTVGFSVLLFVTAAMTKGAYDVLLNEGEYSSKKKYRKAEKIIGTAATVYWPTVTAIYLIWSFGWNAWNNSWIVWPVAGVLFGAIAGGISVWYSGKE